MATHSLDSRKGLEDKGEGFRTVFRDAIILTLVSCVIGLLVNLVHPERIPFFAEEDYEILVPCPEPGGEVTPMEVDDRALWAKETFLVDARAAEFFTTWTLAGARNMPYDYLDPTPDEAIHELARQIARAKAQRVVVFGDGDTPDTGEQLGKEISGKGIKNVFFVRGGAPALRTSGKGGARP